MKIDPTLRALMRQIEELNAGAGGSPPNDPPSPNGASGGIPPSMEPRVARLEAHMEHVLDELRKLAPVPERLARIETKIEHLPSKGFVVTAGISAVAALTGLLVLLQHLGVLH